jgi:hypothetical protein
MLASLLTLFPPPNTIGTVRASGAAAFEHGLRIAAKRLGCPFEGGVRRGSGRAAEYITRPDPLAPPLELLELRLLLVEFGQRELLDLEFVLDLDEKLLALGDQLPVLSAASLLPGLLEAFPISVSQRLSAQHQRVPAELRDNRAEAIDRPAEEFDVRKRDHGLLEVERPGTADLAPDGDALAGLSGRHSIGEQQPPAHARQSVKRVTLLA